MDPSSLKIVTDASGVCSYKIGLNFSLFPNLQSQSPAPQLLVYVTPVCDANLSNLTTMYLIEPTERSQDGEWFPSTGTGAQSFDNPSEVSVLGRLVSHVGLAVCEEKARAFSSVAFTRVRFWPTR